MWERITEHKLAKKCGREVKGHKIQVQGLDRP